MKRVQKTYKKRKTIKKIKKSSGGKEVGQRLSFIKDLLSNISRSKDATTDVVDAGEEEEEYSDDNAADDYIKAQQLLTQQKVDENLRRIATQKNIEAKRKQRNNIPRNILSVGNVETGNQEERLRKKLLLEELKSKYGIKQAGTTKRRGGTRNSSKKRTKRGRSKN